MTLDCIGRRGLHAKGLKEGRKRASEETRTGSRDDGGEDIYSVSFQTGVAVLKRVDTRKLIMQDALADRKG